MTVDVERPVEADAPKRRVTWWLWAAVAVLLASHVAMALTAMRRNSLTVDEIAHITAGVSYWKFGDYRFQPENGNLPQRLAGAAVISGGFSFPELSGNASWDRSNVWELGHVFLWESGNDVDAMIFRARFPIVLISCCLGLGVFLWSRNLHGPWGGLVSLTIYAFSPTILAHAQLATSDLTAAATFLGSLAAAWWLMGRLTPLSVALTGVLLGLAAVSKTSAALLIPTLLVASVVHAASTRTTQIGWPGRSASVVRGGRAWLAIIAAMVASGGIATLVIWAFYGFRYEAMIYEVAPNAVFYRDWDGLLEPLRMAPVIRFLRDWQVLPEAFLYGSTYVAASARSRPSFLFGEYSIIGWPWFFPVAVVLKTPIATMAMVAAGVVALLPKQRRTVLLALTPLLVFVVIYWLVAINTKLNIGHRHMLPVYPPMFILAGGVAIWFTPRLRSVVIFVAAMLVTVVAESVLIWPHHLSYFNVLWGGPEQGYRKLVDSSLDWGQDLKALGEFMEIHGLRDTPETPVYFSYFGTGSPTYYGIRARRLPSSTPRDQGWNLDQRLEPGVYIFSATMLQSVYLATFGQWCERWERAYHDLRNKFDAYHTLRATPEGRAELAKLNQENLLKDIEHFLGLRVGRLSRHLLKREPDARVGYSILIYRVSAEELQEALEGPPPELYRTPAIRGAPKN